MKSITGKYFFEHTAAIIAVLSTACLLSSILYDLGFFFFIDPSLIQYMNISDHIISGIQFLPQFFLILVFGLFVESLYIFRIYGEEINLDGLEIFRVTKFLWLPFNIVLVCLLIILSLVWFLFWPISHYYFIFTGFVSFFLYHFFARFFLRKIFQIKKINFRKYYALSVSMLIMIFSFYIGVSDSFLLIKNPQKMEIHLANGKILDQSYMIKNLSSNLIVVRDLKVLILKDSEINYIQYPYSERDVGGFYCKNLNWCLGWSSLNKLFLESQKDKKFVKKPSLQTNAK